MNRKFAAFFLSWAICLSASTARAASFSFQGLGDLPGGSFASSASGVSADGLVVVGTSISSSGFNEHEAFRWTSGGGMVGLGYLSGFDFYSGAVGVSADGSVVVGAGGGGAFRWTSGGGMVYLGNLGHPGGATSSSASGVSADGSVVVGRATSTAGDEAFLWTSGGGMVSVRDFLVNHGVSNLTDWTLAEATGVSADGRTIVGTGTNPDGNSEAWIATVPEPATFTLGVIGLACACLIAPRRTNRQRV